MKNLKSKAINFTKYAVAASVLQFAVGLGAMAAANLTYSSDFNHEQFNRNMHFHYAGYAIATYSLPGLIIQKVQHKMNAVTSSDYTNVDFSKY